MKYVVVGELVDALQSHPLRGAWIEILMALTPMSAPARSHPSRGAWIEIPARSFERSSQPVAPLTGCVD